MGQCAFERLDNEIQYPDAKNEAEWDYEYWPHVVHKFTGLGPHVFKIES